MKSLDDKEFFTNDDFTLALCEIEESTDAMINQSIEPEIIEQLIRLELVKRVGLSLKVTYLGRRVMTGNYVVENVPRKQSDS